MRPEEKLSVVIIGRNIAEHLAHIYAGPPRFKSAREVIYVDSASQDESVSIANRLGWRTILLTPEGILSPAAGRNVGASQVSGEFVLFLDADMEVAGEEKLPEIITWLAGHPDVAGVCGTVVDRHTDGTTRRRRAYHQPFEEAHFFGGLILLRTAVLRAVGNWNPSVLANEELELHARLKANGHHVVFHPALECLHHTRSRGLLASLLSVYVPLSRRDWLFYGGYGMASRAALKAGSLRWLLRLAPEPPLTLLVGLGILAALALGQAILALVLALVLGLLILRRRSVLYIAACPGLALQMLVGWFRYREGTPAWKQAASLPLPPEPGSSKPQMGPGKHRCD